MDTDGRRRVLVLGGGGIIGRACVSKLLEEGIEVHAVTRTEPVPTPRGGYWHKVGSALGIVALLEEMRPDAVIDLRAIKADDVSAIELGLRFVRGQWLHASSMFVYRDFAKLREKPAMGGLAVSRLELRESTNCIPGAPYGVWKLDCEREILSQCRRIGLAMSVWRLPFIFGPFDRSGRVSRLLSAIRSGCVKLAGRGNRETPLMYSEDVAEILAKRVRNDGVWRHQIYNLANPRPYALRHHLVAMAEALGCSAPPIADLEKGDRWLPFNYPIDVRLPVDRLLRAVGKMQCTELSNAWACAVEWELSESA